MKVKVINSSNNPLPKYETINSAGMDVRADLSRIETKSDLTSYGDIDFIRNNKTIVVNPRGRVLIPTGLRFEIPEGYQISARPRSGLSIKKGLTLCNAVGTIDADFRGEFMIPVVNIGNTPQTIANGERLCQILLEKVNKIEWEEATEISETERGEGGFGSTGTK